MDWDAGHQPRFVRWVFDEKKNIQNERNLLSLNWKRFTEEKNRLTQERSEFEQEKSNFEHEKIGFQAQVAQVKDVIPIAAEIKMMGFDFSTANAWLTAVKNMSVKRGLDFRSAAWCVTDALSKWEEIGGYDTAISNAKHQLELLNMAVEDRREEIAMAADLRKLGLGLNDLKNLMETANNGHGRVKKFEFPSTVEEND
jgi:hypothetical protein